MSGETEEAPSGWTVDTALYFMGQRHADLRFQLDERYETQTKALDAALVAQKTAMETAFTAADRAVQAALESAKEAVTKAETSSEKRFEAVNEFRGQLADQAATLLGRKEADARFSALTDKLEAEKTSNTERLAVLRSAIDRDGGKDAGSAASQAKVFALIGAVGGIVGILLGMVALIAALRT